MTSRAPQAKTPAPPAGAKKLSAPVHLSREAAKAVVKTPARNLLKSPSMTRTSPAPGTHSGPPESSARPKPGSTPLSTSSSPSPTPRKAAMSNKTAPAKDTTQEYREDAVEDTAVRRSPQGASSKSS